MHEQIIAPYHMDPSWLVTAASFLVDRIVPECERIHLPAREVSGGTLSFGRGPLPRPVPAKHRFAGPRKWKTPNTLTAPQANLFDLRRNTPENWAHFLNNHLPLVFTICAQIGIDPREALLVLPQNTPGYILGAADMLGLETLTTDAQLDGEGILFDVTPWTATRAARHTWVQTATVHDALSRIDAEASAAPHRVFLSRRNTRAPLNEAEIFDWLRPQGFVKIYPEDLSATQQFQLFRQAETIVAVHGAGLAPLLYMQPGGRLRHLVEVLHAGHMTDVYRVMAQQVGVNWIGVRGRLKPEYIKDSYAIEGSFKTHSLDNFEMDLAALKTAFELGNVI